MRAARWTIRLLGGFELRQGDLAYTDLGGRAPNLLFARLALAPGIEHRRDELANWLWPAITARRGREIEDPTTIRRNRLKHELSELRLRLALPGAGLGPPFIANRRGVRLNADVFDCDVWALEARRAGADPAAATADELLPEWDDDWIEAQRRRLAARPDASPAPGLPPPAAPPIAAFGTTFVGREMEVARLRAMVETGRLVVVRGPGGCGKTRLAAQTADLMPGFALKALVPLSERHEIGFLAHHVCAVLGIERPAASGPVGADALGQLRTRLGDQRMLLVLDNVEQLEPAGFAAEVDVLLGALPRLHLLLTSRHAFRHPQARHLALTPLPLPESTGTLVQLRANPCIALYEDRAKAAQPSFRVGLGNVQALVDIVRTLGGLPLVIEIAASRVRDHPPRRMLAELAAGIEVLARPGARGRRAGRHGSLEALLRWSWAQLDAPARGAVSALACFAVSAAEDAWRAVSAAAFDPQDLLDRSLVLLESEPTARYRLQPLVREFVGALMAPAEIAAVRTRHLAHFASLAGSDASFVDDDMADFIAAIGHAIAIRDLAAAAAIALPIGRRWAALGTPAGGLDALRALADRIDPAVPGAIEIQAQLARLLLAAGHAEEAEWRAQRSLQVAGRNPTRRAWALLTLTQLRWLLLRDPAATLGPARRIVRLASRAGLGELACRAMLLEGAATLEAGLDVASAQRLFVAAERGLRALGDASGARQALPGIIACLMKRRRFARAIALAAQAERDAAAGGDIAMQMLMADRLAVSHEARGEYAQALEVCRRKTRIAFRHGLAYQLTFALWNQCGPLLACGQPETSALLLSFACREWQERFGPLSPGDEVEMQAQRSRLRRRLGQAREEALWAQGQALSGSEAARIGSG